MTDFPIADLFDDSLCLVWLERHLHPAGFVCPACGSASRRRFRAQGYYDAYRCLDLLVFRPSTGEFAKWYSDGDVNLDFKYQTVGAIGGAAGIWTDAQMIPMDFDGDGKMDLLVFRPSTGEFAKWYSDGDVNPDFKYQAVGAIGGAAGIWTNARQWRGSEMPHPTGS